MVLLNEAPGDDIDLPTHPITLITISSQFAIKLIIIAPGNIISDWHVSLSRIPGVRVWVFVGHGSVRTSTTRVGGYIVSDEQL